MNPASIPSIAIPRSRFNQDFTHSTTFNHGEIIPVDCFEVLPGDDFSVHKAMAEIHMSTPIVPIFGNIKAKIVAMFCPTRLLWEHTEEFYGANKTSAGPQLTTYKIPSRSVYRDGIYTNSVSHYLGKPGLAYDGNKFNYGHASVLKERGYWLCVSEWYRNQQVQNPVILNTQDGTPGNAAIGTLNGASLTFGSLPAKVCKQYDIFTAATTMPQYGSAVELPLGTYAPVVSAATLHDMGSSVRFEGANTLPAGLHPLYGYKNSLTGDMVLNADTGVATSIGGTTESVQYSNLVTDLSSATAAKINDIRYAFQLQKYLERASFGSRFFEVLAVHYGVTSPDARLQRPEYLGGKTAPIVIRTVLSQAGYDASTSQKVGQPGASSITAIDFSGLFSKGFVEPGYLYIFLSTSHERLYSQGLMREDTKTDRFEFYSPEFANLGDQAILNKEIMLTGDATDDQVFGYQGHWDEYRYRKNRVSGLLDPAIGNALAIWTLCDNYTVRPSFSASFIEENRDSISRCLVSGSSGPDYVGDFWIQYAATRELPLYNIPGLVDHFGAL